LVEADGAGAGAGAGSGECFIDGKTMFLISGEGAENRDFGEVLFE